MGKCQCPCFPLIVKTCLDWRKETRFQRSFSVLLLPSILAFYLSQTYSLWLHTNTFYSNIRLINSVTRLHASTACPIDSFQRRYPRDYSDQDYRLFSTPSVNFISLQFLESQPISILFIPRCRGSSSTRAKPISTLYYHPK